MITTDRKELKLYRRQMLKQYDKYSRRLRRSLELGDVKAVKDYERRIEDLIVRINFVNDQLKNFKRKG